MPCRERCRRRRCRRRFSSSVADLMSPRRILTKLSWANHSLSRITHSRKTWGDCSALRQRLRTHVHTRGERVSTPVAGLFRQISVQRRSSIKHVGRGSDDHGYLQRNDDARRSADHNTALILRENSHPKPGLRPHPPAGRRLLRVLPAPPSNSWVLTVRDLTATHGTVNY